MKTKEFNRIVDLMDELNYAILEYQDKEDSLITEKVIDLNDLDTNVLISMSGLSPLAMDIVSFRLEQENQKD
jgi:hypothetical protein